MSLSKKIFLGFLVMIILIFIQGLSSFKSFEIANLASTHLRESRVPIMLTGSRLRESVQLSLAALRGWMLVDMEEFKKQRQDAWDQIDKTLTYIEFSAKKSQDNADFDEILAIKNSLLKLRTLQDKLEALAHTQQNKPVSISYFVNVMPAAKTINHNISKMIFRENRRHIGSTAPIVLKQSKQYMKAMADFRNSFSQAMNQIHGYLLSGDKNFHKEFLKQWRKNEGAYLNLSRAELNARQTKTILLVDESRQKIKQRAQAIFKIGPGDKEWNIGTWKLRNDAAPLAEKLVGDISKLTYKNETYALEDLNSLQSSIATSQKTTWLAMIGLFVVGMVAVGLVARVLGRSFEQLLETGSVVRKIAQGDLVHRIPVSGKMDEIGKIADDVNHMAEGLTNLIKTLNVQIESISATVHTILEVGSYLNNDAWEIDRSMSEMVDKSKDMDRQIIAIAVSIEEASKNIETVFGNITGLTQHITGIIPETETACSQVDEMASLADNMSSNITEVNSLLSGVTDSVNSVANFTSEMNSNLDTVKNQCQSASKESQQAQDHVQANYQVMEQLAESGKEINSDLKKIKTIAQQTDMLALNASIEAAGAGEAGKGFSVVANEVKLLAKQTENVTTGISKRIKTMQSLIEKASGASLETTSVIKKINHSNQDIFTAVDEQTKMTNDISHTMADVADVANQVSQKSTELQSFAETVSQAAGTASNSTQAIVSSAKEMGNYVQDVVDKVVVAQKYIISIFNAVDITKKAFEARRIDETFHMVSLIKYSVGHMNYLTQIVRASLDTLEQSRSGLQVGELTMNVRSVKLAILEYEGRAEQWMRFAADGAESGQQVDVKSDTLDTYLSQLNNQDRDNTKQVDIVMKSYKDLQQDIAKLFVLASKDSNLQSKNLVQVRASCQKLMAEIDSVC
jgi:methyl-accepting chemotaxis protein